MNTKDRLCALLYSIFSCAKDLESYQKPAVAQMLCYEDLTNNGTPQLGYLAPSRNQKPYFNGRTETKSLKHTLSCRSRSHKNSYIGKTQGSFSPGPSVYNSGHEQMPREDQEEGKHNTMLPVSTLS